MSSIKIVVKNCNNIDSATISLTLHKLNIRFAPNGTGKSTIAKAVQLGLKGGQNLLSELIPFKLKKENTENKQPEVSASEELRNIMCFNEEYVSQFVFKPNELINNSFDIFIRTEDYKQREREIEDLVGSIKQLFFNNPELESLISNLKEIGDAFKLSKSGISKSSIGMKGLSAGNKLQHIPAGLEPYTPFIKGENCVSWIDWQTKGYDFLELSNNCPYCSSHVADKKDQIRKVGQEYDKNTIKNLISVIKIIEKLGDYFSDDTKEKLTAITALKNGIEAEHEAFLATLKRQADNFTEKLEKLRTLSAFQFKEGEKIPDKLSAYKLDLQFFSELNSTRMQEAIAQINTSIDCINIEAGQLEGKINAQRAKIKKTVKEHQKNINEFLEYAGYRYAVEIAGEGEQAQLKLRHIDHDEHLVGGSQHLSFGERNAFAIVLFMYECLAKNPALIILDDPISSFDKNKKYAILEMLFRRDSGSCLKGRTVLMLTHDVEPIIDTIVSLEKKFFNQTSSAFLKLAAGQITEIPISKDDIQTFPQICNSAITSQKPDVIKLIYIRRLYEISDNKGDAYQVLSNLFKKRKIEDATDTREPIDSNGNYPTMESAKFQNGNTEVSNQLSNFSYENILNTINSIENLKELYGAATNGYDKLQLFRLLDFSANNSVIQKFICESYHIENELICQLDPAKFDTIPEYVIAECDQLVKSAGA